MFVWVYQIPTFPPHCGDNVNVKTQHIYQAMDIPILFRFLGEEVVTNDRCIIYSIWCTSHAILSHPKNILISNTKYDIRWYIVQPISKHIPNPSLVSLSNLSIIFHWMSLYSLESHLMGEPCDYFLLSIIHCSIYLKEHCVFNTNAPIVRLKARVGLTMQAHVCPVINLVTDEVWQFLMKMN